MNRPPARILINGDFLCRRLTGIERYAHEITRRLDALSESGEIAILLPANAPAVTPYKRLHLIRHSVPFSTHLRYQMRGLQPFLLSHREYLPLEYGNACLPFSPGIVFLHDIYCEFFPDDFHTPRDRLGRLYSRAQYRLIARRAKRIVTVSCFSRDQIAAAFGIDPARMSVIYPSADHIGSIEADNTIFDAFPVLRDFPFYFSLGSLSKRKNIRWTVDYAAKHPDSLFALSGTALPTTQVRGLGTVETPPNILLLGYLDDGKVKALMEKCKAFLFPSYFEGFGLPPLEALKCGAPVIVANAASLPEVYGPSAHYIDPDDTNVDLDTLLAAPVTDPAPLFAKYSYDTAARQVLALCREVC